MVDLMIKVEVYRSGWLI